MSMDDMAGGQVARFHIELKWDDCLAVEVRGERASEISTLRRRRRRRGRRRRRSRSRSRSSRRRRSRSRGKG